MGLGFGVCGEQSPWADIHGTSMPGVVQRVGGAPGPVDSGAWHSEKEILKILETNQEGARLSVLAGTPHLRDPRSIPRPRPK